MQLLKVLGIHLFNTYHAAGDQFEPKAGIQRGLMNLKANVLINSFIFLKYSS